MTPAKQKAANTAKKAKAPGGNSQPREMRVQSVSRATNLLMLVATRKTNGSGKALAQEAGLAVPTAHHLLATLVSEGFLAQDERARYLLGPKVAVLAEALQRELTPPNYLLEALQGLVAETGETSYLAAWRHGEIHLISAIEGHHPVRVSVPTSPYHDAHARATGKLFLAFLDEDVRNGYLGAHPLRKLTSHTITVRKRLLKDLEATRERGYALDDEEFQNGVSCVSAPVLEDGVMVAAFSLSVPTQRWHESSEELIAAAQHAAASSADFRP